MPSQIFASATLEVLIAVLSIETFINLDKAPDIYETSFWKNTTHL